MKNYLDIAVLVESKPLRVDKHDRIYRLTYTVNLPGGGRSYYCRVVWWKHSLFEGENFWIRQPVVERKTLSRPNVSHT